MVMKKYMYFGRQFVSVVVGSLLAVTTAARAEVDFQKDIAPIFSDHCVSCHGQDKAKSGLRLDSFAAVIKGGDSGIPSIVPGDTVDSLLVELITSKDKFDRMPPKGDPLTAQQIKLIEDWIKQGAKGPDGHAESNDKVTSDHWSLQPVERPSVPQTQGVEAKNPIDAFLQVKLDDAGVKVNPGADALTLIRRASIVLTGLPPNADRVERFKDDYAKNPDRAYEALVDELLASQHFGERWAQHWLDVIRWAETNGSEANLYRKNAWVYRDYVIRAFNEDKPYDQFIYEQIAGDTVGMGEAMGFLVAGPHVPAATVGREPAAIRQARADRMDEVMQTVGASMMGMTVSCARCHNHKFDPISINDYYAMTAVFADVEFGSRFPELSVDHPRRRAGDAIWGDIAKQRGQLRSTGPWIEDWGAYVEVHFNPVKSKAIRIRFNSKNVSLDEVQIFGASGSKTNYAHADQQTTVSGFPEKGFEGRNPIQRVNDGQFGTMVWRAKLPPKSEESPWVQFDFNAVKEVGRIRLSTNRVYFNDTDYLARKPGYGFGNYEIETMGDDGQWKSAAGSWWIQNKLDKENDKRSEALNSIQQSIKQLADQGPQPSFIGRLVPPKSTHVLLRGSPESPRDEVFAAGPEVINGDLDLKETATGKERRSAFAHWLATKENPLTARVLANRLWHHVFGSGIVTTTSDFGIAGAAPTHPELLDWLAAELVEPSDTRSEPWSMKSLIRLLVTSEAFKRSSRPSTQGIAKDAGSALLWRYPPRRVEAEVIRDAILQASGKLDQTIGGRSYRIHNVKKTYAQWEVVDNAGPDTWRRMIYQERMRRVDDQIFTAFDFPDCGQVRAKRPVSTTPLQALNLLNSPFVVKQSELIAERAERETRGQGVEAAIQNCFVLLLNRKPTSDELANCMAVVKESGLAMVCRALLNSNEFAFLP